MFGALSRAQLIAHLGTRLRRRDQDVSVGRGVRIEELVGVLARRSGLIAQADADVGRVERDRVIDRGRKLGLDEGVAGLEMVPLGDEIVRVGITPEINAVSTLILAVTLLLAGGGIVMGLVRRRKDPDGD